MHVNARRDEAGPQRGNVRDVKSAFQHYLVDGKPGYVPHEWATLSDALGYIKAGGGIAVIAHPGRYKLTRTEMRKLLSEFKEEGGAGIPAFA